jgi:hypothetical protein
MDWMWGRYSALLYSGILTLLLAPLVMSQPLLSPLLLLAAGLTAVGVHDDFQTAATLRANFPILGHLRYFFESVRPELRQYFWEDDKDELPYSRNQRSMSPIHSDASDYCTTVGEGEHADEMSLLNISGTSFGSLSPCAIEAHNTGEGSLSRYHQAGGGGLIGQISTGYFGCRTADGRMDRALFTEKARLPQVKMIEIKLRQGAKSGHGGMLMGSKVTRLPTAGRADTWRDGGRSTTGRLLESRQW